VENLRPAIAIKFESRTSSGCNGPRQIGISNIEQFAQGRNRCVGSVCSCWKVSIGLTS